MNTNTTVSNRCPECNAAAATSTARLWPMAACSDWSGQALLTLKTPWDDGTCRIVLSPTELIEKLAALVPHAVIAARSRGINQMWQIHRPQSSGEPPFVSCLDASPTRSKRHTFPGRHTDSTR